LRAAVCLSLTGAVAACGQSEDLGHTRVLRFALTEYRMNPQHVRVDGGQLTIVVRNVGRLSHNFVITRNDQVQARTTPLPPGSRTQLTLFLPPGTYDLHSTLFSDQALGLYGTLTVTG
jgi:hypothetical protein